MVDETIFFGHMARSKFTFRQAAVGADVHKKEYAQVTNFGMKCAQSEAQTDSIKTKYITTLSSNYIDGAEVLLC
jgi:hypothetical protein